MRRRRQAAASLAVIVTLAAAVCMAVAAREMPRPQQLGAQARATAASERGEGDRGARMVARVTWFATAR